MGFHINTKCVQAGYDPKNGESRVVPIVQSTTFKYDSAATLGKLFDLEERCGHQDGKKSRLQQSRFRPSCR